MKVYVYYRDTDNSCGDPDCCGGPSPSPAIIIFSSLAKAIAVGLKKEDLKEIELDSNKLEHIGW